MKNNIKKYLPIIIVAVILFIILLPKFTFLKNDEENKPKGKPGMNAGVPVDVIIVKNKNLDEKISASGTLLSNEEAEIRSEVSGRITKIYFDEGSKVNKNDLLVKINDSELQAQLEKQNSKRNLAKDKVFRYQQMFNKELASKEEYDVVQNELNAIDADIQLLKAQIDKTEIRAPFSGKIGLRSVSEGSYISPAAKIATIQSINPIKIDFAVPEKYFNKIEDGIKISFTVQGSDNIYSGKIYAIEPKIDEDTRTLKVRAISKNERSELLPGSFAKIEIKLDEVENAVMIPSHSVVPDINGVSVYKITNGKASPVRVTTGMRNENNVQILSGLNSGDTIVTSGILQVKPGVPVKINSITKQK